MVENEMSSVLEGVDKTADGVCVQASTLGSLEALLEAPFLIQTLRSVCTSSQRRSARGVARCASSCHNVAYY